MQKHNWNTVALYLGALALQIGGLHSWREALSPPFVAGCVAAFAAVMKAMYQPGPNDQP